MPQADRFGRPGGGAEGADRFDRPGGGAEGDSTRATPRWLVLLAGILMAAWIAFRVYAPEAVLASGMSAAMRAASAGNPASRPAPARGVDTPRPGR